MVITSSDADYIFPCEMISRKSVMIYGQFYIERYTLVPINITSTSMDMNNDVKIIVLSSAYHLGIES